MIRARKPAVFILAVAALAACGAQSPQSANPAAGPASTAGQTLASAGRGPASAKADVIGAFERLGAARSYREITEGSAASGQERMQIEFVAPDRLRVTAAEGVQTVIGEDMYLQIDGGSMKQPVRAGVLDALRGRWTHTARMLALPSTTVEAVGSERIDGREARKYRIFNAEAGGAMGMIWISEGYPLRIETQDEEDPAAVVTHHYSHIDHPDNRIDPPG